MKAAAFGKKFLTKDEIDPDVLFNPCKLLKIKNALMTELGLAITYVQLVALGNLGMIQMILNLKSHFIALEVCKILKLSTETVSSVFRDWALTMVDRDFNTPEDEIAERIYERFNQLQAEKDMKINDIALTEIAHEAAKKDKKVLAKKLLEKETSITRKIPVLVWMKEYESSLEQAFLGRDTNLINLVLIKFFTSATVDEVIQLFKKAFQVSSELVIQIKNFLLKTHRESYVKLLFDLDRNTELSQREAFDHAFMPLSMYPDASTSNAAVLMMNRVENLKKLKAVSEQKKDKETLNLIANEIKTIEYNLNVRSPSPAAVNISEFKVRSR
jgi:vacuolar protein sorting-associated protein 16